MLLTRSITVLVISFCKTLKVGKKMDAKCSCVLIYQLKSGCYRKKEHITHLKDDYWMGGCFVLFAIQKIENHQVVVLEKVWFAAENYLT